MNSLSTVTIIDAKRQNHISVAACTVASGTRFRGVI